VNNGAHRWLGPPLVHEGAFQMRAIDNDEGKRRIKINIVASIKQLVFLTSACALAVNTNEGKKSTF
jgi:hypothetical protein